MLCKIKVLYYFGNEVISYDFAAFFIAAAIQVLFTECLIEKVIAMAVELQSLIEKVSDKDLELVAGKEGMNHLVTWVHMVETVDATTFLEGNEVAVSTGIGLTKDEDFLMLIKALVEHNAAAILINIGPYVSQIPQSVIDCCNENHLPMFTVPWRVHLAEIIRIFTYAITISDQEQLELSNAFKNAIFFPNQEDLYIIPLSHQNFSSSWAYSVICIRVISEAAAAERAEKLSHAAISHMKCSFDKFCIFSYQDDIIAVVGDYDTEKLHAFSDELISFIMHSLSEKEKIYYGVGKITKSVRCIYKSYSQARAIMKMHEKGIFADDMTFYDELGVYKLIMNIHDSEILYEYYKKELGALESYDMNNGTNFYHSLKDFLLKYNGSIMEMSNALFMPQNMIINNLDKISEILNCDLYRLDARTRLSVAFMVKEILSPDG